MTWSSAIGLSSYLTGLVGVGPPAAAPAYVGSGELTDGATDEAGYVNWWAVLTKRDSLGVERR